MFALITIQLIGILLFGVVKNELPSIATVKQGADIFSKIMDYYINKITQYKALTDDFNLIKNNIAFLSTDGQKVNNKFNQDVADLFAEKVESLKSMKKKILKEKESYEYVQDLERFQYSNVRDVFDELNRNATNPAIQIVGPFPTDVPINLTQSFVHIPTNIYAYSTDMLNKVIWTQKIDDVFIQNQRNDTSLIMEEYCEPSGFMRMFPGNLNGYSGSGPDLYDCRNRVWYQMSSASQKDVVIVIDSSGSMAGTNIIIAGIIAKALIDTLTENDYFNVLTVSKSATFVSPCVKFLIQATKFNKERMKYNLNNLTEPSGQLNLAEGISAAFKTLYSDLKDNYNRTFTSFCNKLIMVISEGIEGDYSAAAKDIFDKMNSDKKVRVFSYRVGRFKSPNNQALKEMACKNRGYFYQVETLNNIWDTVPEYLKVLSRSIASSREEVKPKISPLYLDSAGAGMILTVSLGIFSDGNYSGVVGVDMLNRAVKQLVPSNSLGFFSHTMLINNNGFVISHPKFKEQGGYLTSPGSIYFEDLEYSQNINDSITLKTRMINRENGSVNLMTYWLYDNNRKLAENNMTYYFNPVNNTQLFSAFALSEVDKIFFQLDRNISNTMYEAGLAALYVDRSINENVTNPTQSTYVDIPNWQYCNITSAEANKSTTDVKSYSNATEVYEFLFNFGSVDNITEVCDEVLVSSLLVTAGYSFSRINQSWAAFLEEKQIEDPDFLSVFVGTVGGYTRFFGSNVTQPPRDSLRTELFEQALAMPSLNILVSVPIRSVFDNEVFFIKVKASSWVERDGNRILMAVTGTEMNSGLIKEIFDNMTLSIGLREDCKNNNTFVCVVVDQNGYIVVGNQGGEVIGRFLGEIQGYLMEHFSDSEVSIFKKVKLKDSQAICPEDKTYNSNAAHLLNPAILLFKLCWWLLCSTLSLMYHLIMLTYSVIPIPLGYSLNPDISINVTCAMNMYFYLFQSNKWDDLLLREEKGKLSKRSQFTLRVAKCGSKSQSYVLAPIPNTNLIFIVSSLPDITSCRKNISLIEKIDQSDDFCMQEEPYRIQPDKCYSETSAEDELPQYCGVARNLYASKKKIFTIFILGLIIKLKLIDNTVIC